mmetsp:Transcript_16379/g.41559  ORF Transcript_16379/g.41559 Transcript_16379/m.41559 type:complete len:144 (-) Transcript_16379:2809-3240(-)
MMPFLFLFFPHSFFGIQPPSPFPPPFVSPLALPLSHLSPLTSHLLPHTLRSSFLLTSLFTPRISHRSTSFPSLHFLLLTAADAPLLRPSLSSFSPPTPPVLDVTVGVAAVAPSVGDKGVPAVGVVGALVSGMTVGDGTGTGRG